MILDHISNYQLYTSIAPNLTQGLQYVANTNFAELTPGKYPIKGEDIFAIVDEYFTKPEEKSDLEAHRKYVDIQFMIKGEEYIQVAPLKDQKISKDIPEKDLTFYEGEGQKIKLSEGHFAIFFQTDAHGPGIQIHQSQQVTKVVLKVAMDY